MNKSIYLMELKIEENILYVLFNGYNNYVDFMIEDVFQKYADNDVSYSLYQSKVEDNRDSIQLTGLKADGVCLMSQEDFNNHNIIKEDEIMRSEVKYPFIPYDYIYQPLK